jgi:hypothetical protein
MDPATTNLLCPSSMGRRRRRAQTCDDSVGDARPCRPESPVTLGDCPLGYTMSTRVLTNTQRFFYEGGVAQTALLGHERRKSRLLSPFYDV